MIDLFVIIIVCFVIAVQIENKSREYGNVKNALKKNGSVALMYTILLLILILFSGLRTTYNDTETYMGAYKLLDVSQINIKTLFEPYGGFMIFQALLKKYISEDPQILILVSSVFENIMFVNFYSKYSKNFGLTIFCHFILGTYVFSMGGIKQTMAMCFSLFAIDNLIQKKYWKFIMWLIVAMLFHPYIICILIIPLFRGSVWDRKLIFFMFISIFMILNLETLLNFAGMIGKDYTIQEMTAFTVNPLRVLVECVPVLFSWACRRKLRKENNQLILMGINMMIINAFMISMGLFLQPIYFARIGMYFSVLNAIVVPAMLNIMYKNSVNRKANLLLYYTFFSMYFLLDMTKLGRTPITFDLFNHLKIF